MSHAMLFQWHSRFVVGQESIEDTGWSGRAGTMKMNENIAQMTAVFKDNGCASCKMIVEGTRIPKTIICRILSDDLKNEDCVHQSWIAKS